MKKKIPTYCDQCYNGPDLFNMVVEDGIIRNVEPSTTCTDISPAEGKICVGLEVNANHLRAAKSGIVTGTAKALHLGATTQIWSIEIKNARDKLVCISRLTLAVINKPQ